MNSDAALYNSFIGLFDTITKTARSNGDKRYDLLNALLIATKKLRVRGEFNVQSITQIPSHAQEYFESIGGFSTAFYNDITLMIHKEHIGRKFFGLLYDYNKINDKAVNDLIVVLKHEFMHYAINNSYFSYMAIWTETFRSIYESIFNYLVNMGYDYFYEDPKNGKTIPKEHLFNHPMFKKALKIYYSILVNESKYRNNNMQNVYITVMKQLYKEVSFDVARFFDNVITRAIDFSDSPGLNGAKKFIYFSVANAYRVNFPSLTIDASVLFHQEFFNPDEIAAYLSSHSDVDLDIKDKVIRTINLL